MAKGSEKFPTYQSEYELQPLAPKPWGRGRKVAVAIGSALSLAVSFGAGMVFAENRMLKSQGHQTVVSAPSGPEPDAPQESFVLPAAPEAADAPDASAESDASPAPETTGTIEEAAVRHGWGRPLPVSDEFNYGSEAAPVQVDTSKWILPGSNDECWPGHAGNGRRCAKNTEVRGGYMRMSGEQNGDSGWLKQKLDRQYGRWEIRSRSNNVGKEGKLYHPLLLIWPTSEQWPADGEYDWIEYTNPDSDCVGAFLHYPHPEMPVQQEHKKQCPVDMTQWHTFGFEWTEEALRGYVDGKQWFEVSGGGDETRRDMQTMPSGHLNIQLDNFHGSGMRAANFDVDWVRVYD